MISPLLYLTFFSVAANAVEFRFTNKCSYTINLYHGNDHVSDIRFGEVVIWRSVDWLRAEPSGDVPLMKAPNVSDKTALGISRKKRDNKKKDSWIAPRNLLPTNAINVEGESIRKFDSTVTKEPTAHRQRIVDNSPRIREQADDDDNPRIGEKADDDDNPRIQEKADDDDNPRIRDKADDDDGETMGNNGGSTLGAVNGIFRHTGSDEANLLEYTIDGDKVWWDVSNIPPGSGSCTSYESCRRQTGKRGWNVPMSVTPTKHLGMDNCVKVVDLTPDAPDAFLFPTDNSKVHVCPIDEVFDVVYCP